MSIVQIYDLTYTRCFDYSCHDKQYVDNIKLYLYRLSLFLGLLYTLHGISIFRVAMAVLFTTDTFWKWLNDTFGLGGGDGGGAGAGGGVCVCGMGDIFITSSWTDLSKQTLLVSIVFISISNGPLLRNCLFHYNVPPKGPPLELLMLTSISYSTGCGALLYAN